MAVTIPSDLIADVMRVADPVRLHAASQKLGNASALAAPTPPAFSAALDRLNWPAEAGAPDKAAAAYSNFEEMMLRNVFESILPKADSGIYGGGTTSSIWRTMTAERLAAVYSQSGGVGLAESLARNGSAASHEPVALQGQWPYFSAAEIRGFVG